MDVNGVKYNRLSHLMTYYDDPKEGIPVASGIYFWVYWPEFDPATISLPNLETLLKEYTSRSLFFTEQLTGGYKFQAVISEQWYPSHNDTLFGLPESKHLRLINYLKTTANLVFFSEFFKEVCFTRPFYVGKANNLRTRLVNQHFKGKTEVLKEIRSCSIPQTEIWVGYKIIPDPGGDEINNIFEEIFSRRIKPGLTKKSN